MISRMAKPEEVIVVETDQGEVVREYMKDTDAISMYKTMRETLGKTMRQTLYNTMRETLGKTMRESLYNTMRDFI